MSTRTAEKIPTSGDLNDPADDGLQKEPNLRSISGRLVSSSA